MTMEKELSLGDTSLLGHIEHKIELNDFDGGKNGFEFRCATCDAVLVYVDNK